MKPRPSQAAVSVSSFFLSVRFKGKMKLINNLKLTIYKHMGLLFSRTAIHDFT